MNDAFILGMVSSGAVLIAAHNYMVNRELKKKSEKLNAELTSTLSSIAEAHNTLTESIAKIDQKANDANMKFEMLATRGKPTAPPTTRFSVG